MNLAAMGRSPATRLGLWLAGLALGGVLWVAAYSHLGEFADAVIGVFGLSRRTPLGEAVHFFFYDTPRCCCC